MISMDSAPASGAAHPNIRVVPYRSENAAATLSLFLEAITVTAAADYTPEQVAAWARPERRDLDARGRQLSVRNTVVALVADDVAGFSDVSDDGYIDMMYVSPRHARIGVGRALLAELESRARSAGAARLYSNVSITARPFFEHHGFVVDVERRPVVDGVAMTNFRMTKALAE